MTETIHALSSGSPPCGVAVVRLSGPESRAIAAGLVGRAGLPAPRHAALRTLHAGAGSEPIDRALVLLFPAPDSFTGEDVVEFQCHGSVAVVAALLRALGERGSRLAAPGEFTRRAFLNQRLDLTQVEALSDLLAAETDSQRRLALANAGGRLRQQATEWRQQLIALLAGIEARLDFSDEEDVMARAPGQAAGLLALQAALSQALRRAALAERVRTGLVVAIIGPVNAGKSSLLNALAQREVAIVTPHAGTTRDVLEVHLQLGGYGVTLLDTAGLRETSDPVEQEGIARARARAGTADFVLDLGPGGNVVSKIDESGLPPGERDGRFFLSAQTGAGLADLVDELGRRARLHGGDGESPLVGTERQRLLLLEAQDRLTEAAAETDAVLQAESLRGALHALDRLTGLAEPGAVLDAIFSSFCIGK